MKLEIEVDDLTEFVSALNNSINALNDIYSSLYFGCDIPSIFEKALENKFGKGNHEAKCEHLRRKLEILKKKIKYS